jgi:dipeptidyl aminopeptidase/acylaminoacyl peptidase
MLKLRQNWGIYDVQDAKSGAADLARLGLADPGRLVIMGGSAGGAVLWGVVAEHTSVSSSLVASAVVSVLLLLWTRGTSLEDRNHH